MPRRSSRAAGRSGCGDQSASTNKRTRTRSFENARNKRRRRIPQTESSTTTATTVAPDLSLISLGPFLGDLPNDTKVHIASFLRRHTLCAVSKLWCCLLHLKVVSAEFVTEADANRFVECRVRVGSFGLLRGNGAALKPLCRATTLRSLTLRCGWDIRNDTLAAALANLKTAPHLTKLDLELYHRITDRVAVVLVSALKDTARHFTELRLRALRCADVSDETAKALATLVQSSPHFSKLSLALLCNGGGGGGGRITDATAVALSSAFGGKTAKGKNGGALEFTELELEFQGCASITDKTAQALASLSSAPRFRRLSLIFSNCTGITSQSVFALAGLRNAPNFSELYLRWDTSRINTHTARDLANFINSFAPCKVTLCLPKCRLQ
eukprot:NODE_762_length_1359_cov_161.872519_g577_i0.p1 GENE.NODE_762_length_1359_cov_161.872519_g577_i0~~NODE_762_length_1359_cov_161.872519_g577_i0.p1  ORF type:complete len:384 (+),score=52.84 NODE_762_length_1359_cov_161.872519_g577_i0:130-1281(+)